MYADINRRQFLRGDLRGKHVPIRPPWSLSEPEFLSLCSTCGDCVTNCPENILINGGGSYPEVDFLRGECTFCGDCANHCPTDALFRVSENVVQMPWHVKAIIADSCLANNRVTCLTCAEACERDAIIFNFGSTGTSKPKLNLENCNGCGACFEPCPVNAISMRAL